MAILMHHLPRLIFSAGLAQLVLVVASLAIPRVLRWNEDTAKLRPLTRQVFWTYAAYIWCTNLAFGLLSLRPDWLLEGSLLAVCVNGFIALYWIGRLLIQFLYFDRTDAPSGIHVRIAEVLLVALFVFLSAVYGAAFLHLAGALAP